MLTFTPSDFVAEKSGSQVYNDKIKAFVDDILPLAWSQIAESQSTPGGLILDPSIMQCANVQGLVARVLEYIIQCTSGDADVIEMITLMCEGLFDI